jgi:hypothetical protein
LQIKDTKEEKRKAKKYCQKGKTIDKNNSKPALTLENNNYNHRYRKDSN